MGGLWRSPGRDGLEVAQWVRPQIRCRYEEGLHITPRGSASKFPRFHTTTSISPARSARRAELARHPGRLAVCLRLRDHLLLEWSGGAQLVAGGMQPVHPAWRAGPSGFAPSTTGSTGRRPSSTRSASAEGLVRLPVTIHQRGDQLIVDLTASRGPGIGPFHLRPFLRGICDGPVPECSGVSAGRWDCSTRSSSCPPASPQPCRDVGTARAGTPAGWSSRPSCWRSLG